MLLPPPPSTLFPYTTLFRSAVGQAQAGRAHARDHLSGIVVVLRGLEREGRGDGEVVEAQDRPLHARVVADRVHLGERSEEHTSELQSLRHLVCRLLLEKKKQ